MILDQGGPQSGFEGFSILQRDVGYRLHGIQILGQADGEASVTEFRDEPAQEVQ